MFTASLSVVCTVFVLNLHHRRSAKHRVPNWLRKIFIESNDSTFAEKSNEVKVLYSMANHMEKNRNFKNQDKKFHESFNKMESFLPMKSEIEFTCPNGPSMSIEMQKKKILQINSNLQKPKTNVYTQGLTLIDDQYSKSKANSQCLIIESSGQIEKEENRKKFSNNSFLNDKINKNMLEFQFGRDNDNTNSCKRFKLKKTKLSEDCEFTESIKCKPAKSKCDKNNENCCLYDIVIDSMKVFHNIKSIEEKERIILQEWKQVASSIDKLLFWVFLIATFFFSLICLVIVPSYQNNKLYEM